MQKDSVLMCYTMSASHDAQRGMQTCICKSKTDDSDGDGGRVGGGGVMVVVVVVLGGG